MPTFSFYFTWLVGGLTVGRATLCAGVPRVLAVHAATIHDSRFTSHGSRAT